jgi:hypothetical protein
VLIVDDDATVLERRATARAMGLPCARGAVGRRSIRSRTPDGIDPGRDRRRLSACRRATGIEAIATIRVMLGKAVPGLLVTGSTSPDVLGAARTAGFPLLHKPLAPAKHRAALTHLVRR